jgi:hypothetical protein
MTIGDGFESRGLLQGEEKEIEDAKLKYTKTNNCRCLVACVGMLHRVGTGYMNG